MLSTARLGLGGSPLRMVCRRAPSLINFCRPYIIYTSDLAVFHSDKLGTLGQLYAEDTQACMHCVSSKAVSTVMILGQTLTALWRTSNSLCLSSVKTKFMLLGTP